MLAPSPAFQKALISISEQQKEHPETVVNYDDIDWNTLPDNINYTRSHVTEVLGSRYARRTSIDDSVIGIKLAPSRRRCAITESGLLARVL